MRTPVLAKLCLLLASTGYTHLNVGKEQQMPNMGTSFHFVAIHPPHTRSSSMCFGAVDPTVVTTAQDVNNFDLPAGVKLPSAASSSIVAYSDANYQVDTYSATENSTHVVLTLQASARRPTMGVHDAKHGAAQKVKQDITTSCISRQPMHFEAFDNAQPGAGMRACMHSCTHTATNWALTSSPLYS